MLEYTYVTDNLPERLTRNINSYAKHGYRLVYVTHCLNHGGGAGKPYYTAFLEREVPSA